MSARVQLARQALVYGWSVLSHSKITWLGWPYATRIFIPQYTTTTAMTTQAASRTLSTGESRIGLLSFAHPRRAYVIPSDPGNFNCHLSDNGSTIALHPPPR